MKLKLGYQELIANAMAVVETVSLDKAKLFLDDPSTVFVDIRDVRELERERHDPRCFTCPSWHVGVLG